jgi:predicted nucleic acid-binding protein
VDILLLDTNIVSYLLKGDSRIRAYRSLLQNSRLALSFMTVAELYQWVFIRNWGQPRIAQLEGYLESYLVLPYDIVLCRAWGQIRTQCRRAGRPISPQDAWVAATAHLYKLPLVTHNPRDFEAIEGIELITEAWSFPDGN